jgi:hypothetical protein
MINVLYNIDIIQYTFLIITSQVFPWSGASLHESGRNTIRSRFMKTRLPGQGEIWDVIIERCIVESCGMVCMVEPATSVVMLTGRVNSL